MKPNKKLAKKLRGIGFGPLIDSPRIRTRLGLPIHGSSKTVVSQERAEPQITVIVPVFNVEKYVEQAVDSILNQTYRLLEVVIVNDGSTDRSGVIADGIAEKDPRVKVIHQANAGLGAARNTGLRNTRAPYVTFVDSDDVLLPRAYELMLASLEASGSDFAIGAVERFDSGQTWTPDWVKEVHDVPRVRTTASEHPAVLWDVFVWNKLFRRSVWDEQVGMFPEGVLYEDQECTAKLFVTGARFDCLTEIVYRWRFREDGSSITQNKHSEHDLEQRLTVAQTVQRVIDASATRDLVDTWYAKLLGDDLYWYYREVPRANEMFWAMLHEGVSAFFAHASAAAVQSIRFDRRVVLLTLVHGTRRDFETCLYGFLESASSWAAHIQDG